MLSFSSALRSRVAPKSLHALAHELLEVQHASGRTIMSVMGPRCFSPRGAALIWTANILCVATYGIMLNWIYEGYVDLWYGVYGLEDDDDDED